MLGFSKVKGLIAILLFFPFLVGYLFALEWGRIRRTEALSSSAESLEKLQPLDCGITLTGGPGRIPMGLRLLEIEKIQSLFISGVHPRASLKTLLDLSGSQLTPESRSRLERQIILEKRSETTFGNALQSMAMADALKCRSAYLITSQVHMNRALRTFQAHNSGRIQLVPLPTKAPDSELALDSLVVEVIKSFFYSLWAY